MAYLQHHTTLLLIFISLLFNLYLCADPSNARGSIVCGQTVSGQSGGMSIAYEFIMGSSPITFTTCNSERDGYLTYLEWDTSQGGWWKTSNVICNPSNNQYPSGCTAVTCSGSHEQWTIDFLTPGTTYWIEMYWWSGSNADNYQINMQCQTATTSIPTTVVSTTKVPTTKMPTTTAPTTKAPTTKVPTGNPTPAPTNNPTPSPTDNPIVSSTNNPTQSPTADTAGPTSITLGPTTNTASPTSITASPTANTISPTTNTTSPTSITVSPTANTISPTTNTVSPTAVTSSPTAVTLLPTAITPSPTSLSSGPTAITLSPAINGNVIIAIDPTASPNLNDGAVVGTTADVAPNIQTNDKQKNDLFADNLWLLCVGIGCIFCIIIVIIIMYIKKRRKFHEKAMNEKNVDRIRVLNASPSSVMPISISPNTPNLSTINLTENVPDLDLIEMTEYNTRTGTGTGSSNYIDDGDDDDADGLYTNPPNVTHGENPSINDHVTAGNENDMTPNGIDDEGDDENDGLYTIPVYIQTTKGDDENVI